ncbi:alpha/beta fold hydrolase [Deinococcus sp. Leaf326]|uniref:alpha/beta fold hydrolase n=1 Tax=Deinococcus sp. Leaf326 TaxID=1736338 RepID=UPI0006F7861B|nr:alpha/beta hydrolase [Deinococcus sp. Leaf326]KQR00873.1 epoxide hydrolase [Deinococcus sp. Leaf326]
MSLRQVQTTTLDIAYEDGGPSDGSVVLLLHGWPDDLQGWNGIVPGLQAAGYRTIVPYLRGFGATRFLSEETPRDGRGVALAQDALDLLNALHVKQCAVVGHDWGARAAYTLATLAPERFTAIAGLALAYQPGGRFLLPAFSQARLFWYQWFMALDQGAEAVRTDPVGFARLQWETWSPPGWFTPEEFQQTAQSFQSPDWAEVTLSGYRSRWRTEQPADRHHDDRYDELERILAEVETIHVPTLMIQGGSDTCDEPASSVGLEAHFLKGYRRVVLDGVGHFPAREAPDAVLQVLLTHLNREAP